MKMNVMKCAAAVTAAATGGLLACIAANSVGSSNADGVDCLIILGGRMDGNLPSRELRIRCAAAASYLRANKNTVAIASGGNLNPEKQQISEACAIKNTLVDMGIDAERVITEENSETTYQNFANSKALIGENAKIAVVSSGYHLFRARLLARQCGLEVLTVSAPSPEPCKGVLRELAVFAPSLLEKFKKS